MRTVTKLLKTTYASLCQSPDDCIGETLYDKWQASGSGEAVIAEAFAALEQSARETTGVKRLPFWRYQEQDRPLKALFNNAMSTTEAKRGDDDG